MLISSRCKDLPHISDYLTTYFNPCLSPPPNLFTNETVQMSPTCIRSRLQGVLQQASRRSLGNALSGGAQFGGEWRISSSYSLKNESGCPQKDRARALIEWQAGLRVHDPMCARTTTGRRREHDVTTAQRTQHGRRQPRFYSQLGLSQAVRLGAS